MLKIGTTTLPIAGWVADPSHPEASRAQRLAVIRQLVEGYGLSAVELTLDLAAIFPQVFDAGFYTAVADLQQELGFACTAHLPFLWVDLASLNELVRQASLDCLVQTIEGARAVEVQSYVLHLWGLASTLIASQLRHPAQREAILGALMGQASRSLAELGKAVAPGNLCVENLEDPLFDLALPLVEEMGASICLDVGHLAGQGGGELAFLERHQQRIREVHLHDARHTPGGARQVRDHLALGQGEINVPALLARLEEIGFDGVVILEVHSQQDLAASLERLRDLP